MVLFDILVALQWYLLTAITAFIAALITLWIRGRLPGMSLVEGIVETGTVFLATWIYQFFVYAAVMGFARRIGRRIGDIDPFFIGVILVMVFVGVYCWAMREHLDFEAPDYAIWFGFLLTGMGIGIPMIYDMEDYIADQTLKASSISYTTESLGEALATSGYLDCLGEIIQLQGEVYEIYPDALQIAMPLRLPVEIFAGEEWDSEEEWDPDEDPEPEVVGEEPAEEEIVLIICEFSKRFKEHFAKLKVGQRITLRGLSVSPFCDELSHCRLIRIDSNPA